MLRAIDDAPADGGVEPPADAPATAAPSTDSSSSDAPAADEPAAEDDAGADPDLRDAASALRGLVLAAERYRTAVSASVGLGTTESQALSHLVAHGDRGQSDLARELGLTSSAATALVDRLERHDVAERVRHPSDRRRTIIRLTPRGAVLADRTHQPLQASLDEVAAADLPAVARWLAVIAESLGGLRTGTA